MSARDDYPQLADRPDGVPIDDDARCEEGWRAVEEIDRLRSDRERLIQQLSYCASGWRPETRRHITSYALLDELAPSDVRSH